MKKVAILLLVVLTIFVFAGCGSTKCYRCGTECARTSENKNPMGKDYGYLCEECLPEINEKLDNLVNFEMPEY